MYILFLYIVVAMAGIPYTFKTSSDWRPSGEFTSKVNCQNAITELKLTPEQAKCLPK